MPNRTLAISNRHPRLQPDRRGLAKAIAVLDQNAAAFRGGIPPGELSIAFVTDPQLALLHDEFLDDPTPTDVITFAADPGFGLAGEICVSVDAARRQKRPARFASELLLYVVHGWLHLAGYDDLQPAKKRLMRAAERRALRLLADARAKPRFRLVQGRGGPPARPRTTQRVVPTRR